MLTMEQQDHRRPTVLQKFSSIIEYSKSQYRFEVVKRLQAVTKDPQGAVSPAGLLALVTPPRLLYISHVGGVRSCCKPLCLGIGDMKMSLSFVNAVTGKEINSPRPPGIVRSSETTRRVQTEPRCCQHGSSNASPPRASAPGCPRLRPEESRSGLYSVFGHGMQPPKPVNCKWGTQKDVCGCCLVCAKGLGEVCGGPWFSSGRCGRGLRCLRDETDFNSEGVCILVKKPKASFH
ncbi:uncharacterized protein LOC143019916 [Oratosquilla oratoria]|uniref:uncharacterized protein LOC143019916 n=1 Tax=Oratosquilla oratoria TaxID=337810 RepID=UPI003F7572CA